MPNLFPAIHISAIAALLASTWPVAQAATVPGQGTWEQTLQGRNLDGNLANGFEAYYDTDLDITWLKDANYIYTSGYNHSVGSTGWADATHWVSTLNFGGIAGWRLPTMTPVNGTSFNYSFSEDGSTDFGFGAASLHSELGHLYYTTLGNVANRRSNDGPFINLVRGPFDRTYGAWTNAYISDQRIWGFNFNNGYQSYTGSTAVTNNVWAVHDGDVGAGLVPEPSTYALLICGGVAIGLAARAKRAH